VPIWKGPGEIIGINDTNARIKFKNKIKVINVTILKQFQICVSSILTVSVFLFQSVSLSISKILYVCISLSLVCNPTTIDILAGIMARIIMVQVQSPQKRGWQTL
jgi:hypothetical protein